ncbi:MAG TPA: HAD family hydrolase [Tepidisphaeraceae bacterium]|nr:HAD family hydrolase [Tepidisphaeraceae bacterium]
MPQASIVFLFDIDNTLLDNDRVVSDLRNYLDCFGPQAKDRYFSLFEELRDQLGYADYLGALQRYRVENPTDARLLKMSSFLVDYPFANRLYPNSLDAIAHVKQWGKAVVLSDGDVVFQPRKAERSGIAEAVDGNVLIYIHKEQMLADVMSKYPADHYVLVDDKVRILSAIKEAWGNKLTTIFPRQGHYALDEKSVRSYPMPDITIDRIGRILDLDLNTILNAALPRRS